MIDYLIEDLKEARGKLIDASSLLEGNGFSLEDLDDLIEDVSDRLKDAKEIQMLKWEAENRQANIEQRTAIGV